jgi:hypothetical protein
MYVGMHICYSMPGELAIAVVVKESSLCMYVCIFSHIHAHLACGHVCMYVYFHVNMHTLFVVTSNCFNIVHAYIM